MIRLFSLARVFGMMLMVFCITYTLPVLTSVLYRDGTAPLFIEDMLLTFGAGGLLWLLTRDYVRDLKAKDGFLLVVMSWTGIAAFSTFPLMSYLPDLSFTDAYFETMSGLTTTGGTILHDLDHLPPAINLWRHELHWIGGMGIIVLAVAVMPVLGVGGRQLFLAETPGPMKDSRLAPRITETAKNLWTIYAGITLLCIVSLKLAGMNWLDAICHAFSTMGLGGFSTHDRSIGYFDSVAIEMVLIVFMLVAGMNFSTHFLALRNRSFNPYKLDIEAKPFLILTLGSALGIAIFLVLNNAYGNFWTALRYAAFNVVSIAADCGFDSTDFSRWPIFAPLWMLFLSCTVACTGSTGGGIKMMRTLILVKQSQMQMFMLTHPTSVNPLKLGKMVLESNIVLSVLGFIFVYFMSLVMLTLTLVISGLDFVTALSAIVACINNAGPGLGQIGPGDSYASLNDFQTWVCTLAMFLGRIEVFTALIIFTPTFWRK